MPNDNEQKIDNINDPRLQQEMVEADPDADLYEVAAPPPDSQPDGMPITYQVKLILGSDGLTAKQQFRDGDAEGRPSGAYYLNVSIEAYIIDPGGPFDNWVLYENNATSLLQVKRGAKQNSDGPSGTSTLHTILRSVGYPMLGKVPLTGPGSLAEHTVGVLSSEPVCGITGRWEASCPNPYSKSRKDKYRDVCLGMKNFPLVDRNNPDLGHSPLVDIIDPITRVATGQARAKFKIRRFFPL
jgi:hypothetical protein